MASIQRMALPAWVYTLGILLGGCMAERNAQVPSDAQMGSEGTGRVTYRAPEDGKVFVFDRNDDRVIYAGDVKQNELVTIDPDTDRVTVGSTVVSEKGLHKGNAHRIFFEGPTVQTAKHTITTEERQETSTTPR